MSSTQHQLIEQCATRLRGIVEALDNIHDSTPHRWSTDLDDVHSSAESLLALIKDQAPTQAAQGLAGAALAQPSPAQAEAERPEVVARVVHSNPVVLGQCGPLNANDELMTVAQHAASVARWAEMFNRVEQQRDAALARVAELELGIARIAGDFLPDNSGQAELALDEMRQALHELLAAPVAQAQHSAGYAEARQCVNCRHIGINDAADYAACHDCRWTGPEPDEDKCPGCAGENCMAAACPECGGRYELVAEAKISTPAAQAGQMPQAWLDVQAERRRQITAEGWTPEHDDEHADGQMAQAAGCYALHAGGIGTDWLDGRQNGAALFWPWDKDSWKPTTPRRDLVKACALALAEIERLDRATATQGGPRDA